MTNKNILKNSLIILFGLVLLALFFYSKLAENASKTTKEPEVSTAIQNSDILPVQTPSVTPAPTGGNSLPAPTTNSVGTQ
jgi:hypothetical protein